MNPGIDNDRPSMSASLRIVLVDVRVDISVRYDAFDPVFGSMKESENVHGLSQLLFWEQKPAQRYSDLPISVAEQSRCCFSSRQVIRCDRKD